MIAQLCLEYVCWVGTLTLLCWVLGAAVLLGIRGVNDVRGWAAAPMCVPEDALVCCGVCEARKK